MFDSHVLAVNKRPGLLFSLVASFIFRKTENTQETIVLGKLIKFAVIIPKHNTVVDSHKHALTLT